MTRMPEPEDLEDDLLTAYGFIGEPKSYQRRLRRIRELADQGKGPGAFLARFLDACGYQPKGKL